MSNGESYAKEKASKVSEGLINRDKSKYLQDSSSFLSKELKADYTDNVLYPISSKKNNQESVLQRDRKTQSQTGYNNSVNDTRGMYSHYSSPVNPTEQRTMGQVVSPKQNATNQMYYSEQQMSEQPVNVNRNITKQAYYSEQQMSEQPVNVNRNITKQAYSSDQRILGQPGNVNQNIAIPVYTSDSVISKQVYSSEQRISQQVSVSHKNPLVKEAYTESENPNSTTSPFNSPNFPATPAADGIAVGVAGIIPENASFLNKSHSFLADDKDKPNNVRVERKKSVSEVKSKQSKYFKKSKDSSSMVRVSEVTEKHAQVSSLESQLGKKGISAYDFISPLTDIARNDDMGGQVIADVVETSEKTYKFVKKAKKAKATATGKGSANVAKTGATASKTTASTSATASNSSSVIVGSTAKNAGAKAVPIPPIVYLWILVGIVVTAILLMMFGLMSFGATQISFSIGSNEGDVTLELSDPDTKNNIDLVNWCVTAEANKEGYVYGAFGQMCTIDYLEQQASRYPGDDEAGGPMRIAGERWLNKRVYDCIGLIKAYGWYNPEEDYIEYDTDIMQDFSANTIWNFVDDEAHGEIDSIPDIPGIAVCMDGHIGVYIGNGEVIEAQGTETGVVKSQLENGSWTHWLEIPGIIYKDVIATEPISPIEPTVPNINTSDPVIITDPVEN